MKILKKILPLFLAFITVFSLFACQEKPETVSLKSISLKSAPTKTVYYVNEDIDVAGAKLTLIYTDGSEKELTVTPEMIAPKVAAKGEQDVTITYKEGDVSKTAKFTVNGVELAATDLTVRVEAENGATMGKTELAKKAKALGLDAIHDTVHEMARDEARHGKAFEGLLKRYFG